MVLADVLYLTRKEVMMESTKKTVVIAAIGGLVGGLLCLLLVLLIALPGRSAVASDNADGDSATAEVANPLEGRTIYLYDTHHGVALSDDEAAELAAQSEARGLSSKFVKLATSGYTVTDPTSGGTYAVEKAGEEVHLGFSGAEVYVMDGVGLNALVRGQVDENDFAYYGEIEGEFGTMKLYI